MLHRIVDVFDENGSFAESFTVILAGAGSTPTDHDYETAGLQLARQKKLMPQQLFPSLRARVRPKPEMIWSSDMKPLSSPHRVLIVEDELLIAIMLEEIVAEAGFQVVGPVATLPEALALAESERLDAALLDIFLDEKTKVFAAADVLAERQIPFAFVTAFRDSEIELVHRDRPVWFKPLIPNQIVHGLTQLVAGG
jgi:CheY-like chemotaxis protein